MTEDHQKKIFLSLAFTVGAIAILAQTTLFREISIVLRSNDLIVGIVISCWLICSGVGSLVGFFGGWSFIFSFFVIVGACSPLWCHFLAVIFSPTIGELWSVTRIIPFVFLTIAPIAFLAGALFRVLSREYNRLGKIECVYIFEGFGALIGGIGALVIAGVLPPRIVMPIVAGAFAGALFPLARVVRKGNIFGALCFISFVLYPFIQLADNELYSRLRPGFSIARFESPKGAIEVATRQDERYLFQGGCYIGSSGDSAVSDESLHPLFLYAGRHRKILVFGGILQGAVSNALLYEPESVVVLIEDEKLARIGAENFALYRKLTEPNIKIQIGDPVISMQNAGYDFDCVIIYSGMPQSSASGRILNDETFRGIKNMLSPGGFVAVIFPVSPNAITPEQSAVLSSVRGAMESVFDSATPYILGSSAVLLAPDKEELGAKALSGSLGEPLISRLTGGAIISLFEPNRQNALRKSISTANMAPNTVDKPVAFLAGITLWERLSGGGFVRTFAAIPLNGWLSATIIFFIVMLLLDIFVFRGRSRIPAATALVGAICISLSILNMYGFQLSVGMLYAGIGLLSALFMGGTVLGAIASSKRDNRQKEIWILLFLMLIPLTNGMIFIFGIPIGILFGMAVFGIFSAYCGFVVGFFFPLALSILREKSSGVARSAGLIYGCDLVGSSLAAPIFGVILIPSLGVSASVFIISIAIVLTAIFFKKSNK